MGNYVSQCVAVGAGVSVCPMIIGTDGCRRRLEALTRVAELMIEAPGHIIVKAADIKRDRRLQALTADETLQGGEVYLLVPAGRARARLCDQEIAIISRLVSGKKSRSASHRKIFPGANHEEEVVKEKDKGSAGQRAQAHGLGLKQWRPVLDTIYES